jgi:predicted RNA-binding Zn ribbon-like protein
MPVSSQDSLIAPHGLDTVIDFVNTLDVESGEDSLEAPGAAHTWLEQHGLLAPGARQARDDGAQALAVREALRAAMRANNAGAEDPAAWSVLERAARRGGLAVHFDACSSVALRADAGGVAGALAQLLASVAAAVPDGSWRRAKACRASDCEWAFYDRSRNRSGAWCDMAVCGNRTKVRAYRSRAGARR